MSDWTNREEILEDIDYGYVDSEGFALGAEFTTNWLVPWVEFMGDTYSITTGRAICDCLIELTNAIKSLHIPNLEFEPYLAIPYFLTNYAGGVDMAAILSAMMKAKFEELKKFIGIEDAYRCALWDAPFEAEYYAFLARTFKYW